MYNDVQQLVIHAQQRINQISELLPQCRKQHHDLDIRIREMIVERAQLTRMVRATQPRRRA